MQNEGLRDFVSYEGIINFMLAITVHAEYLPTFLST